MRRTPDPIEDSPSTVTSPSWPLRCTCVPAHSSLDQSPPMDTTRTRSPYFWPNSAIAPRSEEHTSELHHVAISYAVFCLKKKNKTQRVDARQTEPSIHKAAHTTATQ